MLINVKDCILIFDEGHNMEDVSRDAASLNVTNRQLRDVEDELIKLCTYTYNTPYMTCTCILIVAAETLKCRDSYRCVSAYVGYMYIVHV